MNGEIEKELRIYNDLKKETVKKITQIIQNRIDLIDPTITIFLYNEIYRIGINYRSFVFEFVYSPRKENLYLRGCGKTKTGEHHKEREQAYTYVREIIKRCLEWE